MVLFLKTGFSPEQTLLEFVDFFYKDHFLFDLWFPV